MRVLYLATKIYNFGRKYGKKELIILLIALFITKTFKINTKEVKIEQERQVMKIVGCKCFCYEKYCQLSNCKGKIMLHTIKRNLNA